MGVAIQRPGKLNVFVIMAEFAYGLDIFFVLVVFVGGCIV